MELVVDVTIVERGVLQVVLWGKLVLGRAQVVQLQGVEQRSRGAEEAHSRLVPGAPPIILQDTLEEGTPGLDKLRGRVDGVLRPKSIL